MTVNVSFEYFPPRDAEARNRLVNGTSARLGRFAPEFYSVTYGAGGSTRDGTFDTIAQLLSAGYDAAPHLSIGVDSREQINTLLDRYRDIGVKRIVALRGDIPSGMGSSKRYGNNAETLVGWIREHSGERFHIEVAAYPEVHPDATSASADLAFFKNKIDAGANSAITQYFYSPYAYANFVERACAAGVNVPIVAGVMPITNYESIRRFSDGCGADIPRWLDKNLSEHRNDEKAITSFAVDFLSLMCEQLIQLGAPGLHFYTLNRWGATTRICTNLDLI